MKYYFFLPVIVWLLMLSNAFGQVNNQVEVGFRYDDAGNRTKQLIIYLDNKAEDDNGSGSVYKSETSSYNENSSDEETGYSDRLLTGEFTIYPNPTRGIVYYDCSVQELNDVTITIVDAAGKLLKTMPMQSRGQLDFSSYADGIYFVRITAKGTNKHWKVIKK